VINSPETRLPYILFPNANSIGVQMTDVVPVKIRSITPVRPNSDVALFAIDTNPTIDEMLGPPIPFAIETGKPVIGSRASAVGFERQEVVNIRHFVQLLRVSVGPIEDLHVQARDSVTVNFPCFQVGAVFEGGMSGGPVCDQEGNVIGIVSVGLDTSDASPYGYAASIVCLAELSIDLPNPDGTFSNFSFKQLSQLALIMHSKDFSINYRRTSEGLRILWSNDD
jgi:S1-C subfamily serine protease